MSRRDRSVDSLPDDDQDALVLPYSPQLLDDDDDPMSDAVDEELDVDEDLVRVAWTVERHVPTGEWVFSIFEIGASGGEELLAEVPLDPDTAAEMSTALAGSYQDMTGENVPPPQGDEFAGSGIVNRWWSKAGNTNTERIRVAVLVALLLLVLVAFVGNVLGDWL